MGADMGGIVELIGAMTWPINVIEELQDAKASDELKASMDYHGLIDSQLSYKFAIIRAGALRAMFQLMTPSLTKSRRCAPSSQLPSRESC